MVSKVESMFLFYIPSFLKSEVFQNDNSFRNLNGLKIWGVFLQINTAVLFKLRRNHVIMENIYPAQIATMKASLYKNIYNRENTHVVAT